MSLLLRSEILGLLTCDDKYFVRNRKIFPLLIKMQVSKKPKNFFLIFHYSPEICIKFKNSEKKI